MLDSTISGLGKGVMTCMGFSEEINFAFDFSMQFQSINVFFETI